MLCPYCQKEMALGYIQCRDGLTWRPRRQPVAALSFFGRDAVPLSNGAADNTKTVYAHRCADCQKVIIDCSDQHTPVL